MTREHELDVQDAAIEAAVRAERLSGDKNFVFIRRDMRHLPGLRAKLEDEARESGRILLLEPTNQAERLLSDRQSRMADAPVIPRSDNQKFLENLGAIAAGKIRVE